MKIKRKKHCDKYLSFYRNNFGIHEPYQIIVDLTFCQSALQNRVQIKEQISKYLSENHKLFNTKCILQEGEKIGSVLHGAMVIEKTFETRFCGHADPIPADQCIKSLVNKSNPHGLFVASQDSELRSDLRKLSGIPILHVNHNVIVLEKPSSKSVEASEKQDESKLLTEYQKELLKKLKKDEEPKQRLKRKRKGPKQPNPLSVKKKKKTDNEKQIRETSSEQSARTRRRRKHRAKGSVAE
eukprot:gene5323-5992_t